MRVLCMYCKLYYAEKCPQCGAPYKEGFMDVDRGFFFVCPLGHQWPPDDAQTPASHGICPSCFPAALADAKATAGTKER